MVTAIIAILLMALIIVFILKKDKTAKESEAFFTYNNDGYIILKKRDPRIKNLITIEAMREYAFSTVPDKMLYTSATVGGITTGGVTTIKGGLQATSLGKTGYYKLWFKYANKRNGDWEGGFIDSIVLSDDLFRLATQDEALSYLIVTKEQLAKQNEPGRNNACYQKNSIVIDKIPYKTALYILKWLCCEEVSFDSLHPVSDSKIVNGYVDLLGKSVYYMAGGKAGAEHRKRKMEEQGIKPPVQSVRILPKRVFCVYCGEELGPDAKFCNRCGKPVGREEEPIDL